MQRRIAARPALHRPLLVELLAITTAGLLWAAFPDLGAWLLLLALAPWARRLWRNGRLFPRTPFDWPLLIFLATAGMSLATAYNPAATQARFWPLLAGVLLCLALADGLQRDAARATPTALWFLSALGAVATLFFIATHDWVEHPAEIGLLNELGRGLQALLPRLPRTALSANVTGGLLAALLPFAGALFAYLPAASPTSHPDDAPTAPSPARLLAAALLTITAGGLLLTSSRGAWLALLSAAAAGAVWGLAGDSAPRPGQRRWLFAAVVGLALLVGGGLLLSRPARLIAILEALPGVGPTGRVLLYSSSLGLVQEYPLFGAGLDNFKMMQASYALLTHVGFLEQAHNLYLNVAIQQGLPALAALLVAWLLFARAAWRAAAGGALPPALAAAALSLLVTAGHGLIDDALYASDAILFLFAPLAFGVLGQPAAEGAGWQRRLAPVAVIGALLLGAWVYQRPLRSLFWSNLAAVEQGRVELGVYNWPDWPVQDEVRRDSDYDLDLAVAGFEQALALDPHNVAAHRRLGMIALSLGEYEAALGHLQAAYDDAPWNNATRQLLGEALIVNGRIEEGTALWREVNNDQGQLQLRRFWYRHIGDDQRLAWVEEAMPRRR